MTNWPVGGLYIIKLPIREQYNTNWPITGPGQWWAAPHLGAPGLLGQRGLPLQGGAGPPGQQGPGRQVQQPCQAPGLMSSPFTEPTRGLILTTLATLSTLLDRAASSTFFPSTWIIFFIPCWGRLQFQERDELTDPLFPGSRIIWLRCITSTETARTPEWSTVRCRCALKNTCQALVLKVKS